MNFYDFYSSQSDLNTNNFHVKIEITNKKQNYLLKGDVFQRVSKKQ